MQNNMSRKSTFSFEAENGLIGDGEAHAPVAPRVVHTIVTDLLAPVLLGQDARQS
jgi:hypothetical protein